MGNAVPATGSSEALVDRQWQALESAGKQPLRRATKEAPKPAAVLPQSPAVAPRAVIATPRPDSVEPARARAGANDTNGFTMGPLPGVTDPSTFAPVAGVPTQRSGMVSQSPALRAADPKVEPTVDPKTPAQVVAAPPPLASPPPVAAPPPTWAGTLQPMRPVTPQVTAPLLQTLPGLPPLQPTVTPEVKPKQPEVQGPPLNAAPAAAPAPTTRPNGPTAASVALVDHLTHNKFVIVHGPGSDDGGVVHLRGPVAGHSQPVDIFVPPTYEQDPAKAKMNMHLHGFDIAGGVDASVFNQNNFAGMLASSKSKSALIVPESKGNDATYQAEWVGPHGAAKFNQFTRGLMEKMGYSGLGEQTLTTHSGSGWIGDRIVLNTEFGAKVRNRGHFDDGYGSSQYAGRRAADQAILDRGGRVFAISNAGTAAAAQMDGVYYHRKTGKEPSWDYTYGTNSKGQRVVVATHATKNEHAPTVTRTQLDALKPGALTELNVTWDRPVDPAHPKSGSHHFGLMQLMPKVWQLGE